jgi:hypothetical protein
LARPLDCKVRRLFSITGFDLIANVNGAPAISCHRDSKSRLLPRKDLKQRFHDWQISLSGERIRVRGEASAFCAHDFELDLANANASAYPILLFPRA